MASRSHTESFPVALPIARTWEVMSDTQHLNQMFFGFQASRVIARDGDKARIRGSFGALAPEYDEYPWAFEVPRRYQTVRIFPKGVLKRLEAECRLREDGTGTVVDYTFKIETIGGPIGFAAALVAERRTTAGLARARAFLAALRPEVVPVWPPANPFREAVLARAEAACARIATASDDEKLALARLVLHIAEASEPDVARMRPYQLAEVWGVPRRQVLGAFLRAAQGGLLRLSWDLLCPSCEAPPTTVRSLKDIPREGHCPACDIDFGASFDQNIEATFSPEPAVRASERLVFCHGSPQSTKSWLAQFVVPAHSTHELVMALGAGRYRLQAAGLKGATLIDVDAGGALAARGVDGGSRAGRAGGGADTVRVAIASDGGAPALPATAPAVHPGAVTIVIDNQLDVPKRVQLAHRAFASQAATAADVTATGIFKELFGGEALSPDQHIAVGQRAVLFTDLCGSTAMYERLGDAAAYGLVREHFKLLFAEIEGHGGRVVKTVGDCVMAAFDSSIDAARAGRRCIVTLRTLKDKDGNAPGLQLKVGVHHGPCLAVEANGQVDYFGRTVNIAARVESLASPDELVLSWTAVDDPAVRAFLDEARAIGDRVASDQQRVKGVVDEVDVVRITIP